MERGNPQLKATLHYIEKNLKVLPVHYPLEDGSCSCNNSECKNIGKHPITEHGFQDASNDPEQIKKWWIQYPDANIAIRIGADENIMVIDVDKKNGGLESLDRMEEKYNDLPDAWMVNTGGGGYHFYFIHPGNNKFHNEIEEYKGIEFRAKNGYSIVPPSLHKSGKRYETVNENELVDPPESLVKLYEKPKGVNYKIHKLDSADREVKIKEKLEEMDNTVIIEGGKQWQIIQASEKALIENPDIDVYQRGRRIIRVVKLKETRTDHGVKRKKGTVIIEIIDGDYLNCVFGQSIQYVKYSQGKKGYTHVDLPPKYSNMYLSMVGEWNLPVLSGLIETPTLDGFGRLINKHGYDEETGIYFYDHDVAYNIPDKPTKDDAIKALELLKKPISEFPFVNDEDRSVALAAILTGLVRQSLRTAPMFAFTAPVKGSGKSLLCDVVAMIATGRTTNPITYTHNKEEMNKILLSCLVAGDTIVCFDNVDATMKGNAINTILSQETYRGRILGATKMEDVSTRTLMLCNGNNLSFAGDITRRIIKCNIDPNMEHPDTRPFGVNLYDQTPKRRRKYVEAGLTIIKAWLIIPAYSRPKIDVDSYGGFEQWSKWIREALIWLGEADPCKGRKSILDEDVDRDTFAVIVESIFEIYDKQEIQVATMLKDIEEAREGYDDFEHYVNLRNAFIEISYSKDGEIKGRSVGRYLLRHENRYIGSLKLIKGRKTETGSQYWRVLDKSKKEQVI